MSTLQNASMMNMTEGNPTSLLIRFSIPMLIGNLFQQLYNLVDSVVVGQFVGEDALAAIGATSSISFLFIAMCNGFGSGGGIIASQYFGRKDEKSLKSCIVNAGFIMTICPLLIGVVAFFLSKPILIRLETPDDILEDATIYLQIMCVGLVFVALYNYASSMLRALGDSKTPLLFLVFSCVLNTILDLLFVCVFKMGVFGASIATIISQFLSAILCLLYAEKTNMYFKMSKEDMNFNRKISGEVVKLGGPLSLQFSLIAISCMALQKVVNTFGTDTVAAFTATSRIEQIIHQPYQTLSAALSTYVGQNYGARKMDRVKDGFRKSMWMMVIFSVVMLPIMQFTSTGIMRIFVNEEAVIDMGAKVLRISSLFYIMLGLIYMIRGIQNGLGDSVFAVINGVVEVIGRFAVPVFLTSIAAIGLWGIWWSVGVVWALSGITAWIRYKNYKRRRISLEP